MNPTNVKIDSAKSINVKGIECVEMDTDKLNSASYEKYKDRHRKLR